MIVVPLKSGPKVVTAKNNDRFHPSFVDFETDEEPLRREALLPGERKSFRVVGDKYTRVCAPACVKVVSVEEA